MEALVIELAKKYGMAKAMEILGLDEQLQNPKYAISLGGKNINPSNMLARAGLNKAFSGGLSGIMGPAALMGGALMLGRAFDPMRPGSRNYSPNLRGQVDYLSGISGMIGRDSNSGLMKYGPESVLRGQNVSSMFGTNNYQDQLQNKIDYFEDRIKKGKPINEDKYEQAKKEKEDFFEYRADIRDKAKVPAPTYTPPNIHSGNGGNQNAGGAQLGSGMTTGQHEAFRMARGGIVNL